MNTVKIGVGQLWDEGGGRFLLEVESVVLNGRVFDDDCQVLAVLRRCTDGALTLDEHATWWNNPVDLLTSATPAERAELGALMVAHARVLYGDRVALN